MAEDWEQYYSGFSSNYAPSALSTVNPQQWNTYDPNTYAPQQRLLDYNGSYSALRGWNPDPYALNNSGPSLLGGDWGSVMSQNALYPTGREAGSSEAPLSNLPTIPGGIDPLDSRSFQPYPTDTHVNQGGDYNDVFNVNPYSSYGNNSNNAATGGSQLSSRDDINGLWQQYLGRPVDDAGAAWAGGFNRNQLVDAIMQSNEYQNKYSDQTAPLPTARPISIDTGGASIEPGPRAIDTSMQQPTRNYTMPDIDTSGIKPGPDTFGGRPVDVVPSSLYDQSYMDQSNGSYGSLLGADDGPRSYETMDGKPIQPPTDYSNPIDTSRQNPTQALLSPTGPDSFANPNPVLAGDYFNNGVVPGNTDYVKGLYQQYLGRDADQAGLDYWTHAGLDNNQLQSAFAPQAAPAYGLLDRNYTPMQADAGDKIQDRVQQTGGFTSYAPTPLPPTSVPQQSSGGNDFLSSLYQQYLGRSGDAAGMDYWSHSGLSNDQLTAAFSAPGLLGQ